MRQTFGKYRLIAELGRGGMGQVFLAMTSGMAGAFNKLVVVKQLHSYLASDPEFSRMFFDEARIAARLNHKNVVQTHEAGSEDGVLYLAMEYLEGQPLHRIMERALADFPLEMHLAVLADVLAGLHHAHELKDFDGKPLNVVHRDVSPHNVFVTYDGQIKVVDFGIASAEGRSTKTKHGLVKGKPTYMAPEQARGETVDRRADIFAVGVMMFESLTGHLYWGEHRSNEQIRNALIAGELPPLPDDAADGELVAICRKALAVSADDRYATALDMQRAIESYSAAKLARPSALQIGAEIEDIFRDKRDAMRKAIEKALAEPVKAAPKRESNARDAGPRDATQAPHRSSPSLTSEADAAPTRVEARAKSAPDLTPGPARDAPDTPPVKSTPTPSSRGNRTPAEPATRAEHTAVEAPSRFPFGYAAAAAATVLAAAVAWFLPTSAKPVPDIRIELRATDTDTRFHIDGGPALAPPWIGAAPRDGREHTIIAESPKAPPRTYVVRFDGDVRIAITR